MLVEITEGQTVTIRQDRAYLLFRMHRPKGVPSFEPVFLRKPTSAELEDYRTARAKAFEEARPKLIEEREKALRRRAEQESQGRKPSGPIPPEPTLDTFTYFYPAVANLAGIRHNFPLAKGTPDNLYLIEAIPGDYVLYGTSWGMGPQGLAAARSSRRHASGRSVRHFRFAGRIFCGRKFCRFEQWRGQSAGTRPRRAGLCAGQADRYQIRGTGARRRDRALS
ncbi:MAG: hypothetical protein B7Y97_08180 [Sphingomonas sp. 32-66-10]|nr:MAG: hypothetical protein B7Y97_08180 [Sphingomonas sp. 32-66-10]